MCIIAAIDLTSLLGWVSIILKVAIGLGTVIFVHELGHFLVAKACGVKCEKFMIGFDIGGYKIARQWGETLYGIGILPLGGYVKMLGQDDDPSHIAEQMEKSQVDATDGDGVPIIGPNGEKYIVDRRSYLAKSVPQRMAIISAGVIMNVIFAFIFAVIAYGMGVPYLPSIVSDTVPGSPAWQAGIEPGDEIVQIGSRVNPTFMQLKGGVTLGDLENGIATVVRRAADGKEVPVTLMPDKSSGLATIGIGIPLSLKLSDQMPSFSGLPAAEAKLIEPSGNAIPPAEAKLQGGDEIARIGDVDVSSYRELVAELAKNPNLPLRVTVKRPAKIEPQGNAASPETQITEPQILTFEVPPRELRRFGLLMKMGPIATVQKDSPAAAAGLLSGDVIETVDGQPMTTGAEGAPGWDPVTLPELFRNAAVENRAVELIVSRSTGEDRPQEQKAIQITPHVPTVYFSRLAEGAPMPVPAAGFAYQINNEVLAVLPGSPAAGTSLAAGDLLTAVKVILPPDEKEKPSGPMAFSIGEKNQNIPMILHAIQMFAPGTKFEFTAERAGSKDAEKVTLEPAAVAGAFVPERGFGLEPLMRIRKADSFAQQLQYGWDETVESLTLVFRFLQKLGTQVPFTALGGPGTIAAAAGGAASEGLSTLLIFLTMLSANLAVINFLPIPLLDGGHMVFLAYEGLRGRPANEKIVVALHTLGFVFIISLMLFAIALDVQRFGGGG